ncbi:MAG: proteasome subunit beta [Candidatus Woesearchaeota archaeon]
MDQNLLKTGTTTVGIVCKDGIVLAADKRSTAGHMIANTKQVKIIQITKFTASTQSGLVSDAQLLTKVSKAESALIKIRKQREPKVKEVASIMSSLSYHNIRQSSMVQGIVGFMVGGYDESGFHLYDVGIDGSLTEYNNFNSTGSGSLFAYGVLESKYKEGLSVEEGMKLAFEAVNTAIQKDSASGNGIDIIKITKEKGYEHVLTKQLNTKLEF